MSSRRLAVLVLLTLTTGTWLHAQSPDWDTQALVREAGALTAADLPGLEAKATGGDARSQVLLGLANEMGSAGLTSNAVVALGWLKKAADQGVAWAEMWAGDFYYTGSVGVPKDLYEAMRLYQSSSNHGNPRAAFYAARMYFFGEGVSVNHREAATWFRRALPADPEFVGRMVALADVACDTAFCLSFKQLLGANMAQLAELFVGDWDDMAHEWEATKALPGDFMRCGYTSSNKTSEGEIGNYFCDTDPIADAAIGNAAAKELAEQVGTALPAAFARQFEARGSGTAYHFTADGFPRIRVSYNDTPGAAFQRVTVLIGR